MAFPIGMFEWEPGAASSWAKRIARVATDGYGGDTSNPNYNVIRWDSFATREVAGTLWEAGCYWDENEDLVICVRQDSSNWTFYVYDGVAETPQITRAEVDAHNTCVLAIDTDAFLHIAYDHHDDALNYRRSNAALTSFDGTLTNELSMVGTNESELTYPMFFHDPLGVLYFGFRDGASGNGDFFCYKYTTSGQTWAALAGTTAGKVIDGKGSVGDYSPYWHGRPCFSPNWDGAGTGFMWFAWVWRGDAAADTSSDPSAVRWNGTNWTQADGTSQTMPITKANCDVVHAVAEGLKLQSFNASCIDGNGIFHMFETYEDAADSNQQKIWHSYWNGSAWDGGFITDGNDTPSYEYYSLDAVCDQATNVLRVIIPHPTAGETGIYAYVSSAGSPWSSWTKETLTSENVTIINGAGNSNASLAHDRYQWEEFGVYRTCIPIAGAFYPTQEDFTEWSGYLTATADAPGATLTNPVLKVALTSAHASFWSAVASDGKDVRASDDSGQQLPVDLAEWNYAGEFAILHVHWFGTLPAAPTVRIYAGNSGAVAPGDDEPFGRHSAYPSACRGCWPSGGLTDRTGLNNDFTMTGSPTTNAGAGPMGQTVYEYDGSTQYGLASASVPTAAPMTVMIRANADNITANMTALSIANGAAAEDYWQITNLGGVANDPTRWNTRDGVTGDSDINGYTADTWQHLAGREISASSRFVYRDGVAGPQNTTNLTPDGATRIGIAVLGRSALDGKFDGELADAMLYNIALSAEHIAYDSAMGDQATFWNGWTWESQGGGGGPRRRRLLMRSA